jgi:hypothetical protein
MADTPSAIILNNAVNIAGTEHIMVSQSGNLRRTTLSDVRDMVSAQFVPVTSDPHIAGALWNNAGTLTISAG